MPYDLQIKHPTIGMLIDALLELPPHVRKYSVGTISGFKSDSDKPTVFIVVDDNMEQADIVSCKPSSRPKS